MHTVEEVLQTINREIEMLQQTPPPVEDLHRAVKQAQALFAYGSESTTNQAFWMGFSEMFSSYAWFENYLQQLTNVTPQDVQRVAKEYFSPKNRIIGVYSPNGMQSELIEEE
jgi:zinc protease